MQAGKQLLLEELSSDVRDNLDGLKKKGKVTCVQGIKRRVLNICVSDVEI